MKIQKFNKDIFFKLVIISILLIIGSSLFILNEKARLGEDFQSQTLEINKEVADSIEDKLNGMLASLTKLSMRIEDRLRKEESININIEEITNIIHRYKSETIFEKIYLLDNEGYLICDGKKKYVGDNKYIKKTVNGKEYISPPIKDITNEGSYKNVINFTVPIIIGGKVVGGIGGLKDFESFREYLLDGLYKEGSHLNYNLYLFDNENNFIMSTIEGANIKLCENPFICNESNSEGYNIKVEEIFENKIWHVVTVIENKEIISAVKAKLNLTKLVTAFICIVILLISFIILKKKDRNKEKLIKLAFKDEVTGIDNYNKFLIELEKNINLNKDNLVIVCFDIKNFKFINKMLGHHTGDKILKQIADNIGKYIKGDYIFTRVNNDLFAIALNMDKKKLDVEALVKTIREDVMIHKIYCDILESSDIHLEASIGVYFVDENYQEPKLAIDYANLARQKNKEVNDSPYYIFEKSMLKEKEEVVVIENMISTGLKSDEFQIYYQPKVDIQSNKVVGAEALIRWFSKERGFISPNTFIEIAEKNGQIKEIGRWVIDKVCKDLSEWRDKGYTLIPISINVSKVELYQSDVINYMKATLEKYKIDPKLIEVEITETAALNGIKYVNDKIKLLRDLGLKVSMDDFGTGTSTLSNLRNIDIDTIKIDRSLLIDIEKDSKSKYIIESLVVAFKNLGFEVVCEGIESYEQVEILKKMECDMIQGYVFFKPLNKDDIEAVLIEL